MAKFLIALRYFAIVALLFSLLLLFLRWRYPQSRADSQGWLDYWRNVWDTWRDRKADEREQSLNRRALRGKTVLLADPDEKSARVIVWLLEGLECRVVKTRSGAQAIREAGRVHPDVVIADALLPDISAGEFYRELGLRNGPVIFTGVTGERYDDVHALGRNVACFGKPYDPDEAAAYAGRMLRRVMAEDAVDG